MGKGFVSFRASDPERIRMLKNRAKELLRRLGATDVSDERVFETALILLVGSLTKTVPKHGGSCRAAVGGICLLFGKPTGEICLNCPVRGMVEVEKPVTAEEIFG